MYLYVLYIALFATSAESKTKKEKTDRKIYIETKLNEVEMISEGIVCCSL